MLKRFSAILLLGICLQALGVHEYYSISRSIRAMGTGGAFYGISDDESAVFYNPAGLSYYPGSLQIMLPIEAQVSDGSIGDVINVINQFKRSRTLSAIIDDLSSLEGKPINLGVGVMPYFIKKNFEVAILGADLKGNFGLLSRDMLTYLDATAIADSGILIGYSREAFKNKNFHLGITGKGLVRAGGRISYSLIDIARNASLSNNFVGMGWGVDFDAGFIYDWLHEGEKRAGTGLVFSNLLASAFIPLGPTAPPGLVRTVTVGNYLEIPIKKFVDRVRLLLDFSEFQIGGESDPDLGARTGSFWKHVNWGAEVPLWNVLFLRAGVHQGYLSGGLGLNLYLLKLDFATYEEELLSAPGRIGNRRYELRMAIGFGAPGTSKIR